MKKNCLYKVLLLLIIVMVITACSKSNDDRTGNIVGDNPNTDDDFKMPDVMGEITELIGNQVTLKEIKMDKQIRVPDDEPNGELNKKPDGSKGGKKRIIMTPPADHNSESIPTRPPTEYTGKTLEIIIPTGVKVTQRSRGEDGNPTTNEINISKLKKGDVLSINYASDGKTVESISLSSGMRTMIKGGNGEAGGNGEFGGDGGSRIIINDGP